MEKKPLLLVYAPGAPFVLPYFEREFDEYIVSGDCSSGLRPEAAVMVSSTDVYNAATGIGHDESTQLLSNHSVLKAEEKFLDFCRQHGSAPTVLRCPHIVCTGMIGLPREMAVKIYRGSYFHIRGVDEHLSVIHATDIAKAARCCLGSGATLIATDGADPGFHDLAEALAWRIDQKRIFTISERWARWRYSSAFYNIITNTLTFSSQRLQSEFGFRPTAVCDYLKTHVYDDESL